MTLAEMIQALLGEPVTLIDGGLRVKETPLHWVDVMRQLYNWRVVRTPKSSPQTVDRAWCFYGTGTVTLLRAVSAARNWDAMDGTAPLGWDKNVMTGEYSAGQGQAATASGRPWIREGPQWPLLLDLFCGAGGAGYGYFLAGYRVVGVDVRPQPHYPFEFLQADALEVLERLAQGRDIPFSSRNSEVRYSSLEGFDAIHASPPCQFATVYGNNRAHVRDDHPNLIPRTRELLMATGLPYVIENVYGAREHLKSPVMLCGTSFGIEVRRHRMFESSVVIPPVPCDHGRFTERKYPGSSNRPNGRTVCNIGEYRVPLWMQRRAIGISWMDLSEIAQAIPPAYTSYIGKCLLSRKEPDPV